MKRNTTEISFCLTAIEELEAIQEEAQQLLQEQRRYKTDHRFRLNTLEDRCDTLEAEFALAYPDEPRPSVIDLFDSFHA